MANQATSAAEFEYLPAEDGMEPAIVISGQLDPGDRVPFYHLAGSVQGSAVVILRSTGGALLDGLAIGQIVSERRFKTAVPGEAICASSCALIWLAGATRYVSSSAKIGFHAAFIRARPSGAGNALVGAYLSRLGLSPEAIAFVTSSGPRDITWMNQAVAEQVGIEAVTVPDEAQASDQANEPSPSSE
jgi:hypothetical protein